MISATFILFDPRPFNVPLPSPGVALPAATSSALLKLVRQRGTAWDLKRLRLALAPVPPAAIANGPATLRLTVRLHVSRQGVLFCRYVLAHLGCPLLLGQLSTWDVNETIALCARRVDPAEALLWYLSALAPSPAPPTTPKPSPHDTAPPAAPAPATTATTTNAAVLGGPAAPNELTLSTLIATLAAAADWTPLLYLLAEMKLQHDAVGASGLPLSRRTYETLIRYSLRRQTHTSTARRCGRVITHHRYITSPV